MSQESLPEVQKRREYSIHATSFTAFPSDLKPVLRSYTEIRKQMHQSLQARLNRDYAASLPITREGKKLSSSLQKLRTSATQMRVDATLVTLAVRTRAVSVAKSRSAQVVARSGSAEPARQRPVGVVSIKEAVRDREWLTKGKDAIDRSVACAFNDSYGVVVLLPQSSDPYKYYIRKGNNSKLINDLMRLRPWWIRVKSKCEAHFVWSPRREMKLISTLPTAPQRGLAAFDRSKAAIECSVRFPNSETKLWKIVNLRPLGYGLITDSSSYGRLTPALKTINPRDLRLHNRLEANYHLTHKKALFRNMKAYYQRIGRDYTDVMPLTFHIVEGVMDPAFAEFAKKYWEAERDASTHSRNYWILKPGENSNQGRDIHICSVMDQIRSIIQKPVDPKTGQKRSFIIQKYISKPFLYCGRKFDIRCYGLVVTVNGIVQGYFYQEGYLRTSTKDFAVAAPWDRYAHLTNDAVQKYSDDYGRFEPANKLSYSDFQRYLDTCYPELQVQFHEQVVPALKSLVQDSFKATFWKLDPNHRHACFEVLGYDFMLDQHLRPILIEVNTNPCLALVCPLLLRLIPAMLDNAFHLVLDSLFPDYLAGRRQNDALMENRWELIFHELADAKDARDWKAAGGEVDTQSFDESEDEVGPSVLGN